MCHDQFYHTIKYITHLVWYGYLYQAYRTGRVSGIQAQYSTKGVFTKGRLITGCNYFQIVDPSS